MAPQTDNEGIARKLYDAWNRRDFDTIAGMVSADAETVIVGSGARFYGPEGLIESDLAWVEAFPDGRVTVDGVTAGADKVAIEYTGTGTHTGTLHTPGGDIPPTGRRVTLGLCDVLTIRDGKIREYRMYFDSVSLLTQLGLMPEASVAAET